MTGALSGLSEELIVCLFGLFQGRRASRANGGFVTDRLRETHPPAFRNIARSAALIAAFFIGAIAGARMLQGSGIVTAMTVPLALMLAIAIFDWAMPFTKFPSSVEQE